LNLSSNYPSRLKDFSTIFEFPRERIQDAVVL
jgi:hypothetical protein